MISPAMPESETPETDAVYESWGQVGISMVEHARSLERRLVQAQAERDQYLVDFRNATIALTERAEQAQTRIAELEKAACCPDEQFERMEKDAARYRWLRENADEVHAGESVEWVRKYGSYSPELDSAIDSALKSRP